MKWLSRQNRDLSFFQKKESCIIRNSGTHALLLVGCNFIVHFTKAFKHIIEAAEALINVARRWSPPQREENVNLVSACLETIGVTFKYFLIK